MPPSSVPGRAPLAGTRKPQTTRRLVVFLATLGQLASLLSCAPGLPPAPLLPTPDSAFKEERVAEPSGIEEEAPAPFRLRVGDVLNLRVISQTPLSADRLTVDAAGGLHVPLMGQVDVVGLTLREAEIKVQTELQKLDRFARAGLSVVDSAGHQAIVLGAVAKPGRYPIGPGVRVADLMALAGGPKTEKLDTEEVPQADLAAARVVRSQKALPISVVRALEGVARHNVLVEPGDVLYVPPVKAQHVAVFGEVKNAKMLRFRPGMRLTEAVAGAGGFSASADEADLRLIRGPLSKPKVYLASVKDLTSGKGSDIVLQAGDIVYVTTHWFASITDVLARLTPLLAAGSLAAILATTR